MEIKQRIKIYEISLAIFLFFIPAILRIVDGTFRKSISDYAYSEMNHIFFTLIAISSTLFVVNYIINNKHWYNLIAGLALCGVGLTPHNDYPTAHYICAGIFFAISLLAIPLSSSKKDKTIPYLAVALSLVVIALHYTTGTYSLLIAEWIAMLPICTHFIIKSTKFNLIQ